MNSIPDPYTTSLAVAMYYMPPIQKMNSPLEIAVKKDEEKRKYRKVEPAETLGQNNDVYA